MATHNRAGDITYRWISGNTYEATVTTCTKTSAPADRQWINIDWGDGTPLDSIERSNIVFFPEIDAQINTYVKQHTYPGIGTYNILVVDPNRNLGILNLGGAASENTVFAIRSVLVISPIPGVGVNNSVQLLSPPKGDACVQTKWEHNPAAYDIDGDSLHYELIACLGTNGDPLGNYTSPDTHPPGPNNNISINPVTGTVTWDSPQIISLYNIAILISEYRRLPNGQVVFVGSVIRDIQIDVRACSNIPPVLNPVPDYCVEAGEILNFSISANDPDNNNITLAAFGGPFVVPVSPAVFVQNTTGSNPTGTFNWDTKCMHVRLAPYQVTFQAEDDNPTGALSTFGTTNIRVIAPAPQNPTAEPFLGNIQLNWDQSPCPNATGYKIYRRFNTYGFEPDVCETGVPAYTGYTLLTTVDGVTTTSYLDNNNITFGSEYCYMVVACFEDGAESYASEEFCASIKWELPIITKNSVGATDLTAGRDTVQWVMPTELDTTDIFTGPFRYEVYRGDGFNNPQTLIFSSPESSSLGALSGELIVENINTESQANVYRVDLINAGEFVGSSSPASSVFVSVDPNDEALNLSWNFNHPWQNFEYDVYKWDETLSVWNFLATTTEPEYVDTGLENGQEYCYYVVAKGSYSSDQFGDTLINFSQELCSVPFDKTPPCAPLLLIDCDCDLQDNFLSWTNTNEACEDTDDTEVYYVYYAPIEGEELVLIDSIFGADNTDWMHNFNGSIAGCYAITALDYDFVNNRRNESERSNTVCCDNCPDYRLPNVFTPNGDGTNDFFVPFPYKFVESIDLQIYNRWGQVVFETTDPDIKWDGTHKDAGIRVPDGVYYYIAVVNTIRLTGIVSFELTGNVTLLDSQDVNFK
jgi:gliding motility-associated-like protein